ncbi:MAG TPA: Gldg family protein [Lacibacter sp.]|nr:Gldg family protein [Lacibacter sp.]HMO88791.1 Gldg family protein [Lacibacter sp.]
MKKFAASSFAIPVVLAILVAVNILASLFPLRVDLTREQRFSLGGPTRNLLRNLEEPVTIDLFLTGEFPAVFRKLQRSTGDLLREMRSYAGNNLVIRYIRPTEFISENEQNTLFLAAADSLRARGVPVDSLLQHRPGFREELLQQLVADSLKTLGILPYTLQVQQQENESTQRLIFPSALVRRGNKVQAVDLLSGKTEYSRDPLTGRLQLDEAKSIGNAEALLEFKFAEAIEKIQRQDNPVIGYLVGNGQPVGPETYDLVQVLENGYTFHILDPNQVPYIPLEFDALLVVKPSQPFSDTLKMKLDQYLMQGGKILWFLDMLHAEKDSLALTAQTLAYDRGLNLDELLFRYGVRINRDLLQDLQCDLSKMVVGTAGGQPQLADVPFNYYPLLQPSASHPLTRNLEPVLALFANTLDTVKAPGIRKHILLTSSPNAKVVSTPALVSLEQLRTIENPALFNRSQLPVGVLLEGPFASLYANRATEDMRNYFRAAYGSFRTEAPETGLQLVVADGDLVLNPFTQREPFPMGYSRSAERSFANRSFLQNSLQYFTGNKGIIDLRNKEITVRLLSKAKLEKDRLTWQLINILTPLLLLVLAGIAYAAWRRSAHTRP